MGRSAITNLRDIWEKLHDKNNQEVDVCSLGELDHEILYQKCDWCVFGSNNFVTHIGFVNLSSPHPISLGKIDYPNFILSCFQLVYLNFI